MKAKLNMLILILLLSVVSVTTCGIGRDQLNGLYNESVVRMVCGLEEDDGHLITLEEGSGILISEDGDIVTARHLIYDDDDNLHSSIGFLSPISRDNPMLGSQRFYDLVVTYENESLDMAILSPLSKIERKFKYAKLSTGTDFNGPINVILYSYPKSFHGLQKREFADVLNFNKNLQQFEFSLKPEEGSSGGGLFDTSGNLFGIIVGYKNVNQPILNNSNNQYLGHFLHQNIGVAISSEIIKKVTSFGEQPVRNLVDFILKGNIEDRNTKVTLDKVLVSIVKSKSETTSQNDLLGYTYTSNLGQFTLPLKIEKGEYFLKIVKEGYKEFYEKIDIVDNTTHNVKIVLEPNDFVNTLVLQIEVKDYRGFPVVGANFGLLKNKKFSGETSAEDYLVLAKSDSDGKIITEETAIDEGVYAVKVVAEGYRPIKGYYRINYNTEGIANLQLKMIPENNFGVRE
ncbi:MAG: hypothetical protein SCALA702_28190 [Melioribacteraceae bacterium]|nr:MAG: hypothetical protein SCALA702_28190 [Melioribacteraceae bacterium]